MQLYKLLFVLALPVIALACEGACITDVTRAWVGNYTNVIRNVLQASNYQLNNHLGQTSPFGGNDVGHFRPFLDAFEQKAPAIFQQAIFPGFFHGKCQRKGIEPAGCPNPDCPVVCGTPGSMIHFFTKLSLIAYNATKSTMELCMDKNSEPYKKVLKSVESGPGPRSLRFARATFYPGESESASASGFLKRTTNSQLAMDQIVRGIPSSMKDACYGTEGEADEKHKPKKCSWEGPMKDFITNAYTPPYTTLYLTV